MRERQSEGRLHWRNAGASGTRVPVKSWHWADPAPGAGVWTEEGPGKSAEGMPTLTGFVDRKEPAKETEEMACKAGGKPGEICHDPREEGVARSRGVA